MKLFYFIVVWLFGYHAKAQRDTVVIKGVVTCNTFIEPVQNAEISLKLSGGYTFFQKTDTSGKYEFKLKADTGSQCSISITATNAWSRNTKQGCFFSCKDVGTAKLYSGNEYIKDFKLSRAYHCGEKQWSPIRFNTNSIISCNDSLNKIDSLKYDSFNKVISDLYDALKSNPTITIELQGHASTLEKNGKELALYRTQIIKEILIAKGINRKRIETASWGSEKLLVKDAVINKVKTKEEKLTLHLKNQRVIFRIVNWDFKE